MLEKELRANWDSVFYPEPEPEVETFGEEVEPVGEPVLLAAGPSGTMTDGGAAFGVFPQMKPRRAGASEVGANLPLLAADVAAGGGKGLISGGVGLAGDVLAIGRGLYEIGRRGGDQSAVDAFMSGMEKGFILPTSDDVDKWLTQNIGPVVPPGGPIQGAREAAAGAGRLAGELVADPFVAVKGAKAAAKGVKSLRPSSGQSNVNGVSYATTQEGPFYRVSKAGDETSPADTGAGRIYPGTVIENRAGSGRPSVYGDASGQADQELQIRLAPESNTALRVAEQVTERAVGQPYRVDLQIEPSSLRKQSPVGLAYDLAATRAPGYDRAVFDAYKADPEYGPLIERLGLSSYDDLVKAAYQQLEKETVDQFNALVDLVTTDVWTSMGYEAENETRRAAFASWRVSNDMMARAQPNALFMHCLPAHRGEEVDADVIDGPQSVVWDEAENRLHVQKALMEYLLLGRVTD